MHMAGVHGASSSVLGLASRRLILRLATAAAALTFVPTCSAYVASSRAALNFPAHAPLRRQMTGRSRHHQNALAPGAHGLRASMRGYRKSLVQGKVGKLEKMSRGVFDLQDALLQLKVLEREEEQEFRVTAGPAEPAPKHTAVVGSGPAGLATAIMMARYFPPDNMLHSLQSSMRAFSLHRGVLAKASTKHAEECVWQAWLGKYCAV